jgi:hypothetical protein
VERFAAFSELTKSPHDAGFAGQVGEGDPEPAQLASSQLERGGGLLSITYPACARSLRASICACS